MMRILKILILGILVLSIIFALNFSHSSLYFPIKTVRVYGNHHTDKVVLQKLVTPLVNHGYFKVNIDYIKDKLLQMPWTADIFVKRNWPDRIDITLTEKKPVAYWNGESLLSDQGQVFIPQKENIALHLPNLAGPIGKQEEILRNFNDMNRLLIPLHAKISYLELTPYLTWKLTLDNGLALRMSHKDSLTRLDQFVKVYAKIVGNRAEEVDYIDLRYSNGIAIRWREMIKV